MTNEELQLIKDFSGYEFRNNVVYFDPARNPGQLLFIMKSLRISPTPPCYGSDKWAAEVFVPKDENNLSHRCHFYTERDTLEEAVLASALMYAQITLRDQARENDSK